MRTVKQVSDLTGISVRMLHYYDEIGLLKPSTVTDAGYRLYDDEVLESLQQILFFKELDIPLKEIKEIMDKPNFNKMQALENQKKLLIIKRNRLNGLIELINKTIKGENTMSFEEFDMTEYYNILKEYNNKDKNRAIKRFGDPDKFNEMLEEIKANEDKIVEGATKTYGSMKNFVEAMKEGLNNPMLTTISDETDKFEDDFLNDNNPKLKELSVKLLSDLTKDPSSEEIQQIAKEITDTVKKDYKLFNMDIKGDTRWYHHSKSFSKEPKWIEIIDKKYGSGSAKFWGEVFKIHLKDKMPKLDRLYVKLTSDLSKDPTSKEIQEIVHEIAETTKENYDFYRIDSGLKSNAVISSLADLYLKNANNDLSPTDKKFGKGGARFIGESFKFYCENND
ncbi:MerR family transcriptional regulator [Clostridium sp. SHJSY1]|uniref:MerR family transcriptional regulator n=1 Tax=Clostridium sp. SHJSY1 TaxID=2942483 RepID=UPI0028748B68|nr:MerR family transcriptional regulator [Clostridium sp. SHJSY1]MDS0526747.1 MerR family transcriptional regulator [Clostridium sp. SHJSY1]